MASTPPPTARRLKRKARAIEVDSEEEGDNNDDEVQVLAEAPPYLRKVTNESQPIQIEDDSDDEEPKRSPRKKQKLSKEENKAGGKKARFGGEVMILDEEQDVPIAGPSTVRRGIITAEGLRSGVEVAPLAGHSRLARPTVARNEIPNHHDLDRFALDIPPINPNHRLEVPINPDPFWPNFADFIDPHPAAGPLRRQDESSNNNEGVVEGDETHGRQGDAAPFPAGALPDLPVLTTADYIPQILDILPDLDTEWALARLTEKKDAGFQGELVGAVIQDALEIHGGYPKATSQKLSAGPDILKKDYADKTFRAEHRKGPGYADKCLAALNDLFTTIPSTHISVMFIQSGNVYYPTYEVLAEHQSRPEKPYKELKRHRAQKGAIPKGKGKASVAPDPFVAMMRKQADDALRAPGGSREGEGEWEQEHEFLEATIEQRARAKAAEAAKETARQAEFAAGNGLECGCCFGEELMIDMFQCSEGHLFCRECSTRHAEIKLGDQITAITCMDGSGCPAPFPEMELKRLLSTKSLELYHRLKFASELALAEIEGLETCPACDYAVVIDNPDEKLFVCQHEGCKQVSCRKCRRREHLPKSCEEMEADRKLDKRHAIEDAMSDALIRRCPKCSKPYLKDSGCNKIICSGCRTISCYICQKEVTNGYGHFDQNPQDYRAGRGTGKCILWDNQEAQKDQEAVVRARDIAREEAQQRATEEGIQLGEGDLDVDVQGPVRPPMPGAMPVMPIMPLHLPNQAGFVFQGLHPAARLYEPGPGRHIAVNPAGIFGAGHPYGRGGIALNPVNPVGAGEPVNPYRPLRQPVPVAQGRPGLPVVAIPGRVADGEALMVARQEGVAVRVRRAVVQRQV